MSVSVSVSCKSEKLLLIGANSSRRRRPPAGSTVGAPEFPNRKKGGKERRKVPSERVIESLSVVRVQTLSKRKSTKYKRIKWRKAKSIG